MYCIGMNPLPLLATALAALSFATLSEAQGFYPKGSPVLELTSSRDYTNRIANSNHTSIVEFYAPWCGHCRNLKPTYEKVAKSLNGLAKVAAINCDEESTKAFCNEMGVVGFPTLKIVKPSRRQKPIVEEYRGGRSARELVDVVKDRINNHVVRLTDATLDTWLSDRNESAKAIMFSSKGATSALVKAIAIDFLDSVSVAQVRDKEKATSDMFGITTYPSFVLLPGGDKAPITYTGKESLTKQSIIDLLSVVASPNPDPAPKKPASKAGKKASQTIKRNHAATDDIPIAEDSGRKPYILGGSPAELPSLDTPEILRKTCLTHTSGICILALPPAGITDDIATLAANPAISVALSVLGEVFQRHATGGKVPPLYRVLSSNSLAGELRTSLGLAGGETRMQLFATSGKKKWFKRYDDTLGYEKDAVEAWVDAIKMGEGKKEPLPESLLVDAVVEQTKPDDLKTNTDDKANKQEITVDETQDTSTVDTNKAEKLSDAAPVIDIGELSDDEVEKILEQLKRDKPKAAEHDEL